MLHTNRWQKQGVRSKGKGLYSRSANAPGCCVVVDMVSGSTHGSPLW
ncbi:hypothetical protein SynROS8604_03516 [Synechococcus sp. ROS8604]|nr:hypothetical protein SynROS8604_03516 [Synechococcus sp. ROS8604]